MSIPQRLIHHLDEHHVSYETLNHPPRFTAQELAEIEHVNGQRHAKVVILKDDDRDPLMMVLPSNRWIDFDKMQSLTGHPVTLAREDEFDKLFPDCERGTMPPFGDLYGLPTYVDPSFISDEEIVFEAGTHTDAMKMRYRDWAELAHPIVKDFAIAAGHAY